MAGRRAGLRLGCRRSGRRLRCSGCLGRRACSRGLDSRCIVGRSPPRVAQDVPGIVELHHPTRIAAMVGVILPCQDAVGRSNYVRFGSRMDLKHFIQVGHCQSLQRPSPRRAALVLRKLPPPLSPKPPILGPPVASVDPAMAVLEAAGCPTVVVARDAGQSVGPVAAELIEARPPPSPSASRAPAAERRRRALPPRRLGARRHCRDRRGEQRSRRPSRGTRDGP